MAEEKIFIMNDLHLPYIDKRAYLATKQCMKDEQPDTVMLVGDVVDFEAISRFVSKPEIKTMLKNEIDMTKEWFKDLRKTVPNAHIIYVKGNHEERLENYLLTKAPELSFLDGLKLENILELESYGIKYINQRFYKYKGTLYSHIDKSSINAGASAKSIGLANMCDTVHGHSHKTAHIVMQGYTFIENGCLCEPQQKYVKKPTDFTQAFTILKRTNNNTKHYQLIHIKNHQFYYGNKLYKG